LASGEDLEVHLSPGRDINHLLTELGAMGLAGPFQEMILVSVNGKLRDSDYVLGPGDVVDLHITMAGG
jgi:molybdopterin converting factor small subunit